MVRFQNRTLKTALTLGVLGFTYIATAFCGWAVGDLLTSKPELVSTEVKKEKRIKTTRQENLEEILDVTQQLVNISTYEFEYRDFTGNLRKEAKDLYFIGSAVGIYKNLEENALYFLSCDHVTSSPEEIRALGIQTKPVNGLYQGTIEGSEQMFYCTEPIEMPGFSIIRGKLKSKRLGLFRDAWYDSDGSVRELYLDEATELADTGDVEEDRDFIYNDDITLLKIAEHCDLKKYSVWEGDWADETQVRPGQEVYATGYPLGLSRQITQGIISSEGDPRRDFDDNFYFTSAQINPGNSGGGVWAVKKVSVKGKDGKTRIREKLEFLGLGRLKFYADGIGGVVKIGKIKDFLRREGYSYIYQK